MDYQLLTEFLQLKIDLLNLANRQLLEQCLQPELTAMRIFKQKYASHKTFKEKVKLVEELGSEYPIFPFKECEQPGTNFKNVEVAEKLRLEGNTHLKNRLFTDCIKAYTQSIATAPSGSLELALAYGNRSAVLFEVCMYNECIDDIERALDNGFPESKSFKLLLRQAGCYRLLNKKPQQEATIAKAVGENCTKEMFVEQLNGLVKGKRTCSKMRMYYPEAPALAYGQSTEVPCASSAVRIQYNKKLGRHLVATRDIKIGDILAVDEPYAYALDENLRYTHCTHCLQKCFTLLPCENCIWAMFCSEKCQKEANECYHTVECPVISKIFKSPVCDDLSVSSIIIIRAVARVGIENLQPYFDKMDVDESMLSDENKRTKGFVNGKYDSLNFETVFNLVHHLELQADNKVFLTCCVAVNIVKLFGLTPSDAIFYDFAALLFQLYLAVLLNVLSCHENSISIKNKADQECSMNASDSSDQVATVLYTFVSILSHSCFPNADRYNCGKKQVIRAILPISKGSVVSTTYVSSQGRTKDEKQLLLKEKYLFDCECEACTKNWVFSPYTMLINRSDNVLGLKLKSQLHAFLPLKLAFLSKSESVFGKQINSLIKPRIEFLTKIYDKGQFLDAMFLAIRMDLIVLFSYQGNMIADF